LVGILLLASVAYLKAEVDEDEIEESMLDDVDLVRILETFFLLFYSSLYHRLCIISRRLLQEEVFDS